ncbi:MAG TPA: hypothetical protein VK203_02865 [Nostocaceae cyanobacterium]|nr:hypothetical protein [Nostocaceae cyanobacterium]
MAILLNEIYFVAKKMNMINFENNLSNLLSDVRENGIVETIIEFQKGLLIAQCFDKRLMTNIHLCFRKAQSFIIEEILKNQKEINGLKKELKEYRRNRDKVKVEKIELKIQYTEFENTVYALCELAYWMLFKSKHVNPKTLAQKYTQSMTGNFSSNMDT